MQSPEKLVTFLASAAQGKLPSIDRDLSRLIKMALGFRPKILETIRQQESAELDATLLEWANLILGLVSDDAAVKLGLSGLFVDPGAAESNGEPRTEEPRHLAPGDQATGDEIALDLALDRQQ